MYTLWKNSTILSVTTWHKEKTIKVFHKIYDYAANWNTLDRTDSRYSDVFSLFQTNKKIHFCHQKKNFKLNSNAKILNFIFPTGQEKYNDFLIYCISCLFLRYARNFSNWHGVVMSKRGKYDIMSSKRTPKFH